MKARIVIQVANGYDRAAGLACAQERIGDNLCMASCTENQDLLSTLWHNTLRALLGCFNTPLQIQSESCTVDLADQDKGLSSMTPNIGTPMSGQCTDRFHRSFIGKGLELRFENPDRI